MLLLDTDIPDNAESDRPITHILYVRGREMRLHQELVLGVGGVRALEALGSTPGGLAPQRGALRLPARWSAPGRSWPQGVALDDAFARSAPTASSRSTRPSPPATSASTRTWSGASPGRYTTATAARAPAASRWIGSWSWAVAWRATGRQFDMTALSLRPRTAPNAVSKLHGRHGRTTPGRAPAHEQIPGR